MDASGGGLLSALHRTLGLFKHRNDFGVGRHRGSQWGLGSPLAPRLLSLHLRSCLIVRAVGNGYLQWRSVVRAHELKVGPSLKEQRCDVRVAGGHGPVERSPVVHAVRGMHVCFALEENRNDIRGALGCLKDQGGRPVRVRLLCVGIALQQSP
eukprot:CAMPEP_0181344792 /NCGR_PEP_ID=MMETSP1101-20121128/32390_1 /TAXON_ID=46948 /ORGANISM="Rhodomonas abbreviata, Strain Caron Lab Isolate" /LENGTH=152 /DNA_ID=CAMNT_0023456675 /DNA_START=162 /DNA_END=616 /DNA_ORIENTATION=+